MYYLHMYTILDAILQYEKPRNCDKIALTLGKTLTLNPFTLFVQILKKGLFFI